MDDFRSVSGIDQSGNKRLFVIRTCRECKYVEVIEVSFTSKLAKVHKASAPVRRS